MSLRDGNSADHWAQLRSIVEEALGLAADQRLQFVHARISDPALRAEAEQLLAFDRQASEMFSVTGWRGRVVAAAVAEETLPGATVGSFRILHEIGRGGMGAVYLAERADGAYEQRVALKILRESIYAPEMESRFRSERQILARLVHPGIARLLDGGVTPAGRPYFALEYVEGRPIDRYCDEERLDIPARLRLFCRVAEIVQAAHQQLVLHLDLKPANILIKDNGEPQLLDFGIARLLSEGDDKTQPSVMLMTPRYASPEQAAGGPLGVASDVFSLTTLLYKLLTGVLPYPIEDATPLESARMIREREAILPSKAASPYVAPLLRGDLDVILMQGLRKEPGRRYPTVATLRDDVERYLESRPVLAHRDSFGYRANKFLRRNWIAVTATAAVVLVLLASMIFVVRSERRARRDRAAAERRLQDVRNIAHSYIFDIDGKLENIPGTLAVRELVLKNAQKYLEAMSKERSEDESLMVELSEGYSQLGRLQANPGWPSMRDWKAAEVSQTKAIAIDRELLARHPEQQVMRLRLLGHLLGLSQTYELDNNLKRREELNLEAWKVSEPALQEKPQSLRYLAVAVAPLMVAKLHIGDDDWSDGNIAAGVPWLEKTEAALHRYGEVMPAGNPDPVYTSALRVLHYFRGSAALQMGDVSGARKEFEASLSHPSPGWNGKSEEPVQRAIKLHYAYFLLDQGETDRAIAVAPRSATARVHEKENDALATMEDANDVLLQAIFDLRKGQGAKARAHMQKGLDALETLRAQTKEDAIQAANLAHNAVRLAGEKNLSVPERRKLYTRARVLAEEGLRKEPNAMKAAIMMARCDLGLAEMETDPAAARKYVEAAVLNLQRVIKVRGTQYEASALLMQAQKLI